MDARRSAHWILLVLAVALGGCQAPRADTTSSAFTPLAVSTPAASPPRTSAADLGSDPVTLRAVSSEEQESDASSSLLQSSTVAPGQVQTLPLNPVFKLLEGNASSQTKDEAYQTIGLMGLTGMARVMRGVGNSGGQRGFRKIADLTDDLMQPDEETQRSKLPPFAFGLEWKY